MSENTSSSASAPAFKPYVAPEEDLRESTLRGLIVGSILGIVYAASSVYLALKVGMTVSASIPIAVLSITIFRAFGKATILENNIVQTVGSAGESLAAGVAFTLPSLLLMGFEMDWIRITLIALLGGALGVLMMIPLRQGLIVKEHGKLSYPEGTACAQVLIVGDKGGTTAKFVLGGFLLGALYKVLGSLGKFWTDTASWVFDKVTLAGKPALKGASMSFDTDPVLLGVGYIIGTRTSCIMMAGGVLSYLVLIPAVKFLGPDLVSPLVGNGKIRAADMTPSQLRTAFVLYIGAGAVATGGIITLLRSLPTIVSAFARGMRNIGRASAGILRTERDLSMNVVIFGSLALVAAIALAKPLHIDWVSAALIVVFGFFFVTVSSRVTGEIGSSSNPISGMTIATLLITCLLFVAVGRVGVSWKEVALCTASIVCVAASNGGTTSQDLKTGFLVGATPRRQQIAIMVGVVTSALFIGGTMHFLDKLNTTYVKTDAYAFKATPEAIKAHGATSGAEDDLFVSPDPVDFHGRSYSMLYVRKEAEGLPVGRYLVDPAGAIAYSVDPSVCGTAKVQLKDDGTVERTATKYDAPKAQLFRIIINGVIGQDLPWELVLIGCFIAIMMELCGVSALPFAVGAYLPVSTSSSIFIGGLVRKFADRRSKLSEAEQESSPGVLMSSGLIAGGAILGLVINGLQAIEVPVKTADGATEYQQVDKAWRLDFAHQVFDEKTTVQEFLDGHHLDSTKPAFDEGTLRSTMRDFLENHSGWAMCTFLVLALMLYFVAGRKPKPIAAAPPSPEPPPAPA